MGRGRKDGTLAESHKEKSVKEKDLEHDVDFFCLLPLVVSANYLFYYTTQEYSRMFNADSLAFTFDFLNLPEYLHLFF